jgi:hypothetical protein
MSDEPLNPPHAPAFYDVSGVVYAARCKSCHARLFDGRVQWLDVPVTEAIVLQKCWRCKQVRGFKPHQEYHNGSQEGTTQGLRAVPEEEEGQEGRGSNSGWQAAVDGQEEVGS